MTAPASYEIETSEGDDGTMHPVEQLWTPSEDTTKNDFLAHAGLHITGLEGPTDEHPYPVVFLVLGHQTWADVIEAAAAFMFRIHGSRNLHLCPATIQRSSSSASHAPSSPTACTHGIRTPTTAADASGTTPDAWSGRRPPNPAPCRSPRYGTRQLR
ncbi:hypothetical protein [Streptomyces sp. NPDC087300]|uniref:hypothetical protein n=1 Tax=Streptomyces sp. NPDC087300 TaxID=3365780 RepID=UPI003826C502